MAPVRATSDLLVTGNSFWGRRIETAAESSPLGLRWPFSRLHEFHKSRYDAWITGLECPTVPGVQPTEYEEETILKFNCDPASLTEAAKWFDIVSLANNHTDNQGPAGVVATRRQLDRRGILHFGDPDPSRLDQVCKVVPVAAEVRLDDGSTRPGHLPLGLCGYHGVFEIPPVESLEVMQRLSKWVPVLALPHSGLEYVPQESGIKVDLYRSMIDHGADAVLGDHAHWVQNTEAYRGRPIVYSMGNFMFDQQDDGEVTRSAAIRVRLTVDEQPGLEAWLELGEQCAELTDCTSLVAQARLKQPKVSLGFGVVGTTNPGMLTRPATPEQTAAILDRLDWSRTMAGLRTPYLEIR
ncbi:MAG TPA: CapA family protein [Nocardioidaceae bacterium]|nr:CapA family protein [Nocardioidaceae bacterium]